MSAAGGAMVFMASVPTIAPPATAGAVWVWQPVASSTSMREESVWGWKPRARSYPKQVVESVRDTAGMHQGERIRGMLSKVVQVRAPKAAVTTRSVFMALPLSCFSAWIMAAWRVELAQTRRKRRLCAGSSAPTKIDDDEIDDDGT